MTLTEQGLYNQYLDSNLWKKPAANLEVMQSLGYDYWDHGKKKHVDGFQDQLVEFKGSGGNLQFFRLRPSFWHFRASFLASPSVAG